MLTVLTPYQIIVPLASLLAIAYAWNLAFKQKKTIWESLLWTVFWGGICAITLYPKLMSFLANIVGVKDRENAVFITSIGILFFIVFYLVMRMEEMEQRQTRMIRKLALRDANLEEKGEN